jgi:non-specific serine/threonine protein kinase
LDNCEHVIKACAELADTLLRRCPELQILTTSREPLYVEGEMAWRVPSLALPDPARLPSLERLRNYPAVQLFVARSTLALPSFQLTEQNAPAVAQICNRLDGIPLALELAAARISVLSAEQIAARLDGLLRMLTAGTRTALPRQRTLRATIDWSYDLLSPSEQRLFNRLSVFVGGWSLEAAELVGAGPDIAPDDILELLAHLVDKSLVVAGEQDQAVRYRLLEPMRQYGLELLRASTEEATVHARHLDWFLRFAVQADQELRGPNQHHWLEQLDREHDNLRAALEWAATQEDGGERELQLCGPLALFWYLRDHMPEGRARLERALARHGQSKEARMRALAGAGWMAHFQRDQGIAQTWIRESLALARELGDLRAEAWGLYLLGRTHYFEQDGATARALANASLACARRASDPWLAAWATHLLAIAAYLEGNDAAVQQQEEESLQLWRQAGDQANALVAHFWIGLAARREGNVALALAKYSEVLDRSGQLGLPQHVTLGLASFAAIAAEHSQPERAVILGAAVSRRCELIGILPIPVVQTILDGGLEVARQALGPDAYAAAWTRGLTMSDDDAIAETRRIAQVVESRFSARAAEEGWALDQASSGGARGPDGPRGSGGRPSHSVVLTGRELEVLRLVASGHRSNQIADELVLSVRTVERHIRNIYVKLDVRTRAQAVAFAHTRGLMLED